MKYVTKARILVDTWTRDRVLGTVPLEIHILSFIKAHPHRNLCEMLSFFEDEKHYYVEMTPFGRPGTDLFDWIELHTAMTESEVKSIFHQTCSALEHLHTDCGIVHRDIKDENVVLDNVGRVKVIDFGSAAYLKDGPFDTFHGTLDYASPEVLGGKKYEGRGQDVWAAGILLYTMIYKENPFYNVHFAIESVTDLFRLMRLWIEI
jgi:protein-serine/threonine kinase